jgi:tetratricopeptide (TPR) repeat protein
MRRDFSEFGLSPTQDRTAGVIKTVADEVANEDKGRILFLTAESGCGTSHLLSTVGDELWDLGFRVGTGRLSGWSTHDQDNSELAMHAQTLMASALSVASSFDPTLSLVASVAGFSAAAAQAIGVGQNDEPSELLTRVLRAAAREAPDRPLVCLIDDATWLNGAWWTELQFSFAREIVDRLPLLMVVAVGSSFGPDAVDEDLPSMRVEESLVERDLAQSLTLDALTNEELGKWLDLKPREAIKGVFELTRGRTGEVAELCRAWLAQGAVEHEKGGLLLEDPDVLVDGAATDLASRVDRLRGARTGDDADLIREALAFGALEGRSFTAPAVALAIDCDEDLLEDLFDELVAEIPEAGVLLPPEEIEIRDPLNNEMRTIWRFEFVNRALWRAAQNRLSDSPVAVAADRMLEAIIGVFGGETPANLLSLARLADLAGASHRASRYRGLATGPSAATLKARADLLIAADHTDWTDTEYRDAAYVLAESAMELSRSSGLELLDYTRMGKKYAEASGSVGRRALAKVLAAEAHVLRSASEYGKAEARLLEAREIVKQGSPSLLAAILRVLAEVLRETGRPVDERNALLEKSLRLYKGERNLHGESAVYWNLAGIAAKEERDFARGRELNERALVGMRACLDEDEEMRMSGQRANIELVDGQFDAAREFIDKAIRYETATGDEQALAGSLTMLARIELGAGNYEVAWNVGQSALRLLREQYPGDVPPRIFHVLGETAVARGDQETGKALLEEALASLKVKDEADQLRQVEEKLRNLTVE